MTQWALIVVQLGLCGWAMRVSWLANQASRSAREMAALETPGGYVMASVIFDHAASLRRTAAWICVAIVVVAVASMIASLT